MFGRVSVARLGAVAALAALGLVSPAVPPLLLASAAALVVVAVGASDAYLLTRARSSRIA